MSNRVTSTTKIDDRSKTEDGIRSSEVHGIGLHKMFENAPVGIVVIGLDGRIVEGNALFSKMTGYSESELLSKEFTDIVHPDDLEGLNDRLNSIFTGGIPLIREESRIIRKDGLPRRIDGSISVVRDGKGAPTLAIGMLDDKDDTRDAMEELERTDVRYRLLTENVKDVIWTMDSQMRITYCSPVVEQLLGYAPEEIMALDFSDIIEHDSMDVYQQIILDYFISAREGLLEVDSQKTVELQLTRKDGTHTWTETTFSWILDESEKLEQVFCVSRDINTRKQAEEVLRQSEERFNLVFKLTPYPAILTSLKDETIVAVSDELLRVVEVAEEEVLGRPIPSLGIEIEAKWYDLINREIDQQGSVRDLEVELTTKNGHTHTLIYSAVPLENRGERYLFSIAKDVTEERKVERTLRETEEWNKVLAEATFDAILIHDGGRILEANKKVALVTGYSIDKLIGMNPFDLVHHDDHAKLKESMEYEISEPYEIKAIMKDGTLVDSEIVGADIPYKGGKARIVAVRDISQRKRAELSLQYRSAFEDLILELASRFIGLKPAEIDAHIVTALGEISSFVGTDAGFIFRFSEDRRKANLTHLWNSDRMKADIEKAFVGDGPVWKWSLNKLLKGEVVHTSSLDELPRTARSEKRMLGSMGINSLIGVPMKMEGCTIGFMGLCSKDVGKEWSDDDIDMVQMVGTIFTNALQRKLADQEISNIFEISSDLIGVFDLEMDRWSKTNPAFEKILGYKTKAMLKMDFVDIIHPNDRGRALAYLGRDDSAQGHSRLKTRVLKRDGDLLWIEWTVNASPEDNRLYVFGTDVSEREAARETMMRRFLKYDLEDGNVYLVHEENMEKSVEAFLNLLDIGYDGVAFLRKMDNAIFNGSEPLKCSFHWLSERDVRSAIPPHVDTLEEKVQALPRQGAILVDRLDFIIFKNGFEPTLSFVQQLQELAYLNDHIVILSIDPATLDAKSLARLDKECRPFEPIHKTILSHELLSILKVINSRIAGNLASSYADIISELGMSKPTARKRIRELIYYGYIYEVRTGRRKNFALSDKGRSLFL